MSLEAVNEAVKLVIYAYWKRTSLGRLEKLLPEVRSNMNIFGAASVLDRALVLPSDVARLSQRASSVLFYLQSDRQEQVTRSLSASNQASCTGTAVISPVLALILLIEAD